MVYLNWRRYQDEFDLLVDKLRSDELSEEVSLSFMVQRICKNDPAQDQTILGVESFLLAFLEFLFSRAEGPYSPQFSLYAGVIRTVFSASAPLCILLDLNGADTIGNMILNKRGRLKFAIADNLELMLLLDWWSRFGLQPVTEREAFDAILRKSTISRRIASSDPGLILRLLEVFPSYRSEFCSDILTREDLLASQTVISTLPSHRRYRRLYSLLLDQGSDLQDMIRQEEKRVLPMHVRRNTFLSFLVKQLHKETCQICDLCNPSDQDSPITVHHIVPLADGGMDSARNMLVVCRHHHQAIHAGQIQVRMNGMIEIWCESGLHLISPNF